MLGSRCKRSGTCSTSDAFGPSALRPYGPSIVGVRACSHPDTFSPPIISFFVRKSVVSHTKSRRLFGQKM
uniref:Uncharacterized protein n=1 Tax=Monomastix sp. (strain OKE-1) TaxID=141716 RepID=U5YDY9_MONSK|nr:hypothetical protein [Monomastix sp. OKE-1]AGZ90193.1 hypothetical protein [Monomastix sp. OKE-1]